MKKLFPVMLFALLLSGCFSEVGKVLQPAEKAVSGISKSIGKHATIHGKNLVNPSVGYSMFLIVLEINTNISSLLIDKTKEKIVAHDSIVAKKLAPGSFFYVIPPKIDNGETFYFDEELGRAIRNFLAIGKYGIPVSNVADAEYIVLTNVRESLSKRYGVNYSEVAFSIVDKLDIPVYLASIRVESRSDRNFWYYPTKEAKPVKQLTLKGLSKIMSEDLPNAHGDPLALAKAGKEFTENKGK